MIPLLLISSTVALALLVVHSWKTRGRVVTLSFFIAGIAFGLLRCNGIWLLCKLLGDDSETLKPYVPQGTLLPEIGHASIQVALGWVFALYLAWTVSELILRRLPGLSGRVFMIGGLAAIFMLAICYCMETTAVSVGWWYWELPTRTALFGNVNVWAMEGWFSVVPDFLIPFLVIVCSAARGKWLKWLWVLMFPAHLLGHLAFRWFAYAILVYNAMELLVILLAMFSGLRMARGEIVERPSGKGSVAHALPGVAVAVFLGVLVTANFLSQDGMVSQLTIIPVLMLFLLAWRRLPVTAVLALSVLSLGGWYWIGARALYALVPVAAYGFLWQYARVRGSVWLRLVPPVAQVALTIWAVALVEMDVGRLRRCVQFWEQGDQLALAGKQDEADDMYRRSDDNRPNDSDRFYLTLMIMAGTSSEDLKQSVRLFQHRVTRLLLGLEEASRRDPEWTKPRITGARFRLLLGDVRKATEQYRTVLRYRPRDGKTLSMLGYLLLRQGDLGEAEEVCVSAAALREHPAEVLLYLGVIRFHQGRDEEARQLWERAREREPGRPLARINLERMASLSPDRTIDLRYLAQPTADRDAAVWTNEIANFGVGYTLADKHRLWLEATQFDPNYVAPHMYLVENIYLNQKSGLGNPERALWHARRAVEIARASQDGKRLPWCLLLLSRALLDNNRRDEARRALEEGRVLAPDPSKREFDELLRGL